MSALARLAATLRNSAGFAAKADISGVAQALGLRADPRALGDDCAVIPEEGSALLFAIEGFMPEFVAADPWFSGWCGVMVNLSDIAAMGGRPIAVVDALWAQGSREAAPILAGLRAAAEIYGVPIIGGHSNLKAPGCGLAVAILGRAQSVLTSFDAKEGDKILAAIDLRGRYRAPFDNWDAATIAPAERLRGDLELLPRLAEASTCLAAKDISQGGLVGTAVMLAECSGVAITIDPFAVPRPEGVAIERWLLTFPSFGYLLAVAPENVDSVEALFAARDIKVAVIGDVTAGHEITLVQDGQREVIRNFATDRLICP